MMKLRERLRYRVLFFILWVYGLWSIVYGLAEADTVYTNDGAEHKGIVVEDYADRVVISTSKGEVTLMKRDISEIEYENEEDNLIKLADLAWQNRDYGKAFSFYNKALKINPMSKAAKDGLAFIQGYIVAKDEGAKKDDINKRQAAEQYGSESAALGQNGDENTEGEADRVKSQLGVTLELKGGVPLVKTVDRASAAYEAGIRKGDLIVALWGKLTGYTPLKEIMSALLDRPSPDIRCTIERTMDVLVNPAKNILSNPMELIGASLSMEYDGLTVFAVKDGGSASMAGIEKGDVIVQIDGKSTRYLPMKGAISLIKNSSEKIVRLTVKRDVLIWRR